MAFIVASHQGGNRNVLASLFRMCLAHRLDKNGCSVRDVTRQFLKRIFEVQSGRSQPFWHNRKWAKRQKVGGAGC